MKLIFLIGSAIGLSIDEQITGLLENYLTVEQFSQLSSHGCWCNSILSGGNTSPNAVDSVDELCKSWRQARRCTTLTYGSCHNGDRFSFGYDSTLGCDNQKTTCASDSCKLDQYYLRLVIDAVFDNFSAVRASADQCPESIPTFEPQVCLGSVPELTIVNESTLQSESCETYIGCYVDSNNRALNMGSMNIPADTTENSIDVCRNFCISRGASYFGLQYGFQCFCGNENFDIHGKAPELECNQNCRSGPADQWYKCGSSWRNSVYRIDNFDSCLSAKPELNIHDSNQLGCFRERSQDRALPVSAGTLSSDDKITECSALCQSDGYSHFGISMNRCWCGSDYAKHGRDFDSSCRSCDASGPCGNNGFNNVFEILYPGISPSPPLSQVSHHYVGCYQDKPERALPRRASNIPSDTVDEISWCRDQCRQIGSSVFGIQFGHECFCGENYDIYSDRKIPFYCNRPCGNDNSRTCGGSWHQDIYQIVYDNTVLIDAEIVESRTHYIGCYPDSNQNRALSTYAGIAPLDQEQQTYCKNQCQVISSSYMGVQGLDRCYCGETPAAVGPRTLERFCNRECALRELDLNTSEFCGGNNHNSVFQLIYPGTVPETVEFEEVYGTNYVGCFKDTGDRAMVFAGRIGAEYEGDVFAWCADECSWIGATHMGLQFGRQCFCGGDYAKYGELADEDCNSRCVTVNNQDDYCGGSWKNSVFEILYNP